MYDERRPYNEGEYRASLKEEGFVVSERVVVPYRTSIIMARKQAMGEENETGRSFRQPLTPSLIADSVIPGAMPGVNRFSVLTDQMGLANPMCGYFSHK